MIMVTDRETNQHSIPAPVVRFSDFVTPQLQAWAEDVFSRLKRLSTDVVGVTRESFGKGENAAHELIAGIARDAGLSVSRDRAGNLVITLQGDRADEPFIATGSHLDSVPRGGNFDGAAGVVAGLLALVYLKQRGYTPPRTIKLFALRGEESAWFGKSWLGSNAMFGLLAPKDLALGRMDNQRTLISYLEDIAADVDAIATGTPLYEPSAIHAFIELHIEQGPVLEAEGIPLGIVSSIYGNLRYRRVVCRGIAAHAGAVPRAHRHDAVLGLADLIMRMDGHWKKWLDSGRQLVITHGIVGTNPLDHAISRVAGEASMSVEIRAEDGSTLNGFSDVLTREAKAVAADRGLEFEFDDPIVNPSAPMDEDWQSRLKSYCTDAAIEFLSMPSGAGHDAAVFSQVGVPTAMIFVRNFNGSHNPEEAMDSHDFALGAYVLLRALL